MGFLSFLFNLLQSIFASIFANNPLEKELDLSTLDSLIGTHESEVSTRLVQKLSKDSFTVSMYSKGFLQFITDEDGIITGFEFTPPEKYEMTVTGSAGDDTITAASHDDTIDGAGGNDTIDGGAGDDTIFGGDGNDTIFGGLGADLIDGGAGDDTIDGGDGADVMTGGDGNDTIHGGAGDDMIDGGEGDDAIDGGDGNDTLLVNGNVGDFTFSFVDAFTLEMTDTNGLLGTDTVANVEQFEFNDGSFTRAELEALFSGPNEITGTNGEDVIDGTAGDDIIYGLDGNDTLYGHDGNDFLYGGNNSDTLYGGAGNDVLDGGFGIDFLTGGDGADTFVLTDPEAFTGADRIMDFNAAEGDMLDISNLLTAYDPLTDALEDFVRITDSGANSLVSIDTNGGGDGFNTVAIIIGVTGLTDEQALVDNGTLIV